MTRSEPITTLAEHFPQLTAKDVDVAAKEILDKISETLVAGGGATSIVMKNPKTDQVIVCDGGARAREWPTGQMTADACAEQLRSGEWVRVDGKTM